MKLIHVLFFIVLLVTLTSCPGKTPPDPSGTQIELTADSVYLYSKEAYYWNTSLPAYNTFNPRQYKSTDELKTAEAVMAAVRNYNSQDQSHKYSYATTFEQGGLIKSGEDIDWGFFVKSGYTFTAARPFPYKGSANFKGWYVCYVYPDSDAGIAGVKRGWKINKVNGTTLAYDQASVDLLNSIFINAESGKSADFEFIKPDGAVQTNTFSVKKFTAKPILYSQMITTANNKKVGYFVFNRFFKSGVTELDDLFATFQNQQIDELIVDLRYNLGGVTTTQDALANYIAPSSATGGVMYSYEYNQQLQNNDFPLLKKKFGWPNNFFAKESNTVNFYKRGNINLSRVFFIVSDNTASSSELLINNLKPVMNVQLIGDANTRGKPVGFFGIDLFSKVTFYPVSFRTMNSKSQSDYYTGFTPDQTMYDGVDRNWGDQTEDCLYAVLYYINNGAYPASKTTTLPRSAYPELKLAPKSIGASGMIRLNE